MIKLFLLISFFLIGCSEHSQSSLSSSKGDLKPYANENGWRKIKIEGAFCGNGSDYFVYYKPLDTSRLVIEFMGGGACWDQETCYGEDSLTTLFDRGLKSKQKLTTRSDSQNYLKNDSELFFPYCTGDVFAADHTAQYQINQVRHVGYNNVVQALKQLTDSGTLQLGSIRNLVVSGSSAGAIGALVHAKNIETYLGPEVIKTLILDSPGLHWGPDFWKKFTPEQIQDFTTSMQPLGFVPELNNGNMAPYMADTCQTFSSWHIAILQATRDLVMSKYFGDISPGDHERLVLGPTGIIASTKKSPNCFTWVPRSLNHSFLTQIPIDWANGRINAYEFSYSVINRKAKK